MEASILVLCWNHKPYIRQCLESIFTQTHPRLEILFLDNASTDQSFATAQDLLEQSPFPYQVYQNPWPQSVTRNFNFLLDKASGDFIFTFSADDWMRPDNIAEKIALLKDKPAVGLVFGGGWEYFEDTGTYKEVPVDKFKRGKMARNLLLDPDSYFWVGPAYRRQVLYEVGKWDEQLQIEDLDMNLRVALKYEVDFVPKPLVYYRKHSASFTGNYRLILKSFQPYFQKYKHHKELPMRQWMAELYRKVSYPAMQHKEYTLALKYLSHSFLLYPATETLKLGWSFTKQYVYNIKPVRQSWEFAKGVIKGKNSRK